MRRSSRDEVTAVVMRDARDPHRICLVPLLAVGICDVHDVGCGPQRGVEVPGVDLRPAQLELGGQRGRDVTDVTMDIDRLVVEADRIVRTTAEQGVQRRPVGLQASIALALRGGVAVGQVSSGALAVSLYQCRPRRDPQDVPAGGVGHRESVQQSFQTDAPVREIPAGDPGIPQSDREAGRFVEMLLAE